MDFHEVLKPRVTNVTTVQELTNLMNHSDPQLIGCGMDSYKFINATAAWVRETTRTFLAPESVCREVFSVGEDKVPTISRDETSDESSWRNSSVAWIPSGKLERKLRKVRWSTYNMTVNVTDTDANRTVLVDLARANMSDGIDRTAVFQTASETFFYDVHFCRIVGQHHNVV